MRLGLLGCATALTLGGAAAAQAETIYVTEPDVIATAPGYVTRRRSRSQRRNMS